MGFVEAALAVAVVLIVAVASGYAALLLPQLLKLVHPVLAVSSLLAEALLLREEPRELELGGGEPGLSLDGGEPGLGRGLRCAAGAPPGPGRGGRARRGRGAGAPPAGGDVRVAAGGGGHGVGGGADARGNARGPERWQGGDDDEQSSSPSCPFSCHPSPCPSCCPSPWPSSFSPTSI